MKIAFLSFYNGQVDRGVETYVREVASRLAKTHEVTIIQAGTTTNPERGYKEKVIAQKVSWHTPDMHLDGRADRNLFRRFYLSYWPRQIAYFTLSSLWAMDRETDVVVAVNCGWQSLLAKLWTLWHHKKLIIPGQSGPGWDDRINLLLHPDAFIALTSSQESWAKKNSFGTKVICIPNGVDITKFNPKTKPVTLSLPHPIFLCVAALEKNKRIDLAFKAVAKTKGSLVVLGRGDLQKHLSELGNSLIPNRFLIQSVAHGEIASYFSACDVFTMVPIHAESFGIVYVEAMACGKPVVATNDPIRREIVGEAGFLVDPKDTDAYASALESAFATDWGDIPRKQAEKYSWDEVANQYDTLIRSFLKP